MSQKLNSPHMFSVKLIVAHLYKMNL